MNVMNSAPSGPPPLLFAFAQEARHRASQGHDVIAMEQGQLDFPTPSNVTKALESFIKAGNVHYTNVDGMPELKDAVREKFARENDLHFGLNEITVGAGASQVLFNAFAVTLKNGGEVIIPKPAWTVFELDVEVCGGTVVPVPTTMAGSFKMTANQLEAVISPRTRWLILNSPSNPTGSVYTAAEMRDLAEVLRRFPHVWVISDDLYEHQVYDGVRFQNILNVAPDLRDRVLVVNGVAKTFGMTGWRIGFGAGPHALIDKMKWYQALATASPCQVSQVATIEALTGPRDYLASRRAELQRRRDLLVDGLNAIPGWSARRSGGAFYVYAGCDGVIGAQTEHGTVLRNDLDVCRHLLTQANVAAVPGAAFGLSPCVRFSFGSSYERIGEAVSRIASATQMLQRMAA